MTYKSVATKLLAAAAFVLAGAAFSHRAAADDVVLKNGDKITGTIVEIEGGVMKFTSPVLGTMNIKLTDIKTYKTEQPATVQMKHGQGTVVSPITEGTPTQITTANGQTIQNSQVKIVNPPKAQWTGNIVASGILNRGNTNNEAIGVSAQAALRRQTPENDDRFQLGGDYNFGTTGRGSRSIPTIDNWDANFAYNRYFTDEFYGLAVVGYQHDRIAHLNYRLTPGLGIGYQPFESPTFNLRGEAGLSYLYEEYEGDGTDSKIALRLAYHVDKKLNERVSVFNDVEWLPALRDPADYVLNADAGVHVDFTKQFFGELKVVYKRNDVPPPNTLKDDLEFIAGLGWKF